MEYAKRCPRTLPHCWEEDQLGSHLGKLFDSIHWSKLYTLCLWPTIPTPEVCRSRQPHQNEAPFSVVSLLFLLHLVDREKYSHLPYISRADAEEPFAILNNSYFKNLFQDLIVINHNFYFYKILIGDFEFIIRLIWVTFTYAFAYIIIKTFKFCILWIQLYIFFLIL